MRFVLRILGLASVSLAIPVIGASLGRGGGAIGTSLSLLLLVYVWLWLPRLAHAAFETGKFVVAQRRYRWLARLAPSAGRERAAQLSRAGCYIATNELEAAGRLLAAVDARHLGVGERAVWLNNRACAQLAGNGDPAAALALADEAGALRPDVPALQHTRAMALIALGRIDEAIAILEAMRTAGELAPQLEADRCRELARAWEHKGQTAYAEDYRLRADAFAR